MMIQPRYALVHQLPERDTGSAGSHSTDTEKVEREEETDGDAMYFESNHFEEAMSSPGGLGLRESIRLSNRPKPSDKLPDETKALEQKKFLEDLF